MSKPVKLTSPKKKLPPAYVYRSIWRNPLHFIAFGFGSGVLPVAPGTWGTLIAIPIYMLMMYFPQWLYLVVTGVIIILSVIICDISEKDLKIHDHPGMTLDEIAGYLLTMAMAPPKATWIILGFVLFRIFDIWKPWPIGMIDRKVKGGLGTVLDDLIAAVYAALALELIILISTAN